MHQPNHLPKPEAERQANWREIISLDPEIIGFSDTTRTLVELGLDSMDEVTAKYGTTKHPHWATGSYEADAFMSYHNGGTDGHTSVGSHGAGVPRNALVIAKAVNEAAGRVVYDPHMRAVAFYAAASHDIVQLCGRSMLPEGQSDIHRGDERLSAEYARDTYLQTAGQQDMAQLIYDSVLATAFNPKTGTQNIVEPTRQTDSTDFMISLLTQELVAAADLLGATTTRGPLGALEYCVELLSLQQSDQKVQKRLAACQVSAADITRMDTMLAFIDYDPDMAAAFKKNITGQSKFFRELLRFSDSSIRQACGKGIDQLFPGRLENGLILERFSKALDEGATATELWLAALDQTKKFN